MRLRAWWTFGGASGGAGRHDAAVNGCDSQKASLSGIYRK